LGSRYDPGNFFKITRITFDAEKLPTSERMGHVDESVERF